MQRMYWTMAVLCICVIATFGVSNSTGATVRTVPGQYSTIQAAYDACVAGDTVSISSGTYNEYLTLDRDGTSSSPITIQPAAGATVILDGRNTPDSFGNENLLYIVSNYNIIKGIEITRAYCLAIDIQYTPGGKNNQIIGCNIHHNGNAFDPVATYGAGGIYSNCYTSGNAYIGNYVHHNGRTTASTRNHDQGLYLCGDNEVVVNNLIVANAAYGIQVAGYDTVNNMKIYNNTIVSEDIRSGIMLWLPVSGVDIANNIFYGNAGYGIDTNSCTGSGVQIRNNLFYNNRDGTWNMTDVGSTVNYTTSGNITTSDPLFANPAADWHLKFGSPAFDAGLTLSSVTNDYDGIARPQGSAFDIGCYESKRKRILLDETIGEASIYDADSSGSHAFGQFEVPGILRQAGYIVDDDNTGPTRYAGPSLLTGNLLAQYDLVILNGWYGDTPAMPASAISALTSYVRQGRNLVVVAGHQINDATADYYNPLVRRFGLIFTKGVRLSDLYMPSNPSNRLVSQGAGTFYTTSGIPVLCGRGGQTLAWCSGNAIIATTRYDSGRVVLAGLGSGLTGQCLNTGLTSNPSSPSANANLLKALAKYLLH